MEKEPTIKHFYNGRVFYDEESYGEHVKNFPNLPLNKKDFGCLGSMLFHTIWMQLERNECLPNGRDWNAWLGNFFLESLDKFLVEKDE